MRIFLDYALWIFLAFVAIFIVNITLPEKWPRKIKIVFRITIGLGLFLLIGPYWLTTGERPDETAYRLIFCRIHPFQRCTERGDPSTLASRSRKEEQEQVRQTAEANERKLAEERRRQEEARERLAAEASERAAIETRRLLAERERQRLTAEARERAEAEERRLQEEQERQRLVAEARQRAAAEERRRLEEAERERLAAVARERSAAEERRRREELDRRSRRYAATAVGRNEPTRGLRAITIVDQANMADAESRAMQRCNEVATNCRIVARFSGPGKCVYVAGGTTIERMPGRVRRRVGTSAGRSESEALQKCYSRYADCKIFHTRCNSGL